MRLPVHEDKSIDIPTMSRMIDQFLASGFTYFDTAYVYHEGESERAIKEALVDRYPRDAYTLATKLPAWTLKCPEDRDRVFEEQLRKTGVKYFDYYLLHAVGTSHIPVYDKYDCWNWGLEMKEKGLIRHFGFSFHDTPEVLDELLTRHPYMEFVQLQINYLDWDNALVQSRRCYEVACKHHVPVIIMEPVKGGTLASMPDKALDILKAENPKASAASWALRFCGSLENVMVILSGMSDEPQMADNIKTMADFKPLSEKEQSVLASAKEALVSFNTVPCTGCRYCVEGCPQNILIPDLISCLNTVKVYGKDGTTNDLYKKYAGEGSPASACIQCGQCESVCPQHLNVPEYMEEAAKKFEE